MKLTEFSMRKAFIAAFCVALIASKIFVDGKFCQSREKNPNCPTAQWQGCYQDKNFVVQKTYGYQVLFRKKNNENISLEDWRQSLPNLACECAEKAYQFGFQSYALKFQSICYARKEGFNATEMTEDPWCIRQNDQNPCSQNDSICIGTNNGVSVYKIVMNLSTFDSCNMPEKQSNSSLSKNALQRLYSMMRKSQGSNRLLAIITEVIGILREKHIQSSFSKEESKMVLEYLYGRIRNSEDVDEILGLISGAVLILKMPVNYQNLTVYKELEEPFMDALSIIISEKYKKMWKKSQKIQSLVTLVEEVATTLLLSIEFANEPDSDYHYQTPNVDIAANFSSYKATTLSFNNTAHASISTSSEDALGIAVILYKGIKDFFSPATTREERLKHSRSSSTSRPLGDVASTIISLVGRQGGRFIHNVNGTITFKVAEDVKISRNDSSEAQCVYWSENLNFTLGGAWSTHGLRIIDTFHDNHSNATYYICHTSHLTSFTILMEASNIKISPGNQLALEIITYIGCAISLFCLFLTIFTFPFIRLRDIRFKIHFHLCIALAAAQILFLSGIAAIKNRIACMVIAIFLHYFYTVSFMWMLMEGIHLYQKIVIAYEVAVIKNEIYYATSWGIPVLLVGIPVAVYREGYGTSKGCWLTLDRGFRWAFMGPVLFVMMVNAIILIKVLAVMVKMKANPLKAQNYNKMKVAFKGIVILMPLLGLTWCFGVMSTNSETIVFQYLFAFFNSFQGAFIFVFNYLLNKEVRANFRRTLYRTTTTSL